MSSSHRAPWGLLACLGALAAGCPLGAAYAGAGQTPAPAAGAAGSAAGVVTTLPDPVDTRRDRHPQWKRDRHGNLVFRNEHLVAVVTGAERRYQSILLYPATRPTQPPSTPLAVVPTLGRLTWREGGETRSGEFIAGRVEERSHHKVTLKGEIREGATAWRAELDLWIADEPRLSWEARIAPSAPATLTRFTPVPLQVGREGPHELLFPGVAYRKAGRPGRSPDEGVNGAGGLPSIPLAPDPARITVPLVAISQNGATAGLMWDMRQSWGRPGYPQVRFEGPGAGGAEGAGGYRVDLSIPAGGATAGEVALAMNEEVRLAGKFLLMPEEDDPAEAIRAWSLAYGLPRPASYPSTRTGRRVARQALGSGAAGDEGGTFRALFARMESRMAPDAATRRQFRELADRLLAELRRQGPLDPRLAYRAGGVLPSLEAERARVRELLASQLAGGGWAWEPAVPDPTRPERPFANDPGFVAARALPILRYAVLTGDSTAAGAGIRALEFMSASFRVPYGAARAGNGTSGTGSGDPEAVRAPSLLAAAQATECFLLGFQLVGEDRYMESARYWADAGMAFVQFWGEENGRPAKGAVLPVFDLGPAAPEAGSGAAGLFFARVLRDLVRVRPDELHDAVSEAILGNAVTELSAGGTGDGRLAGELAEALYALAGYDPDVAHVRIRVGPDRMFVASGAFIKEADPTAMRLRLKLRWINETETITTIHGVPARPLTVSYNNHLLRRLGVPVRPSFLPEVVEEEAPGWYYDPEAGLLILRLRHTRVDDDVEIRWPDPRERTPVDRIDRAIKPRR